MQNHEMETRIRRAVADMTPNVYADVISARKKKEQEDTIMEFQQTRKAPRYRRMITGLVAACLVVMVAFGGLTFARANMTDTTIYMDVNPSIALQINRSDKVLSVTAINAEAEAVLSGMDLADVDYQVAVNAIIGAMLSHGFLGDANATVLVSVESSTAEKAETIKLAVTDDIKAAMATVSQKTQVFLLDLSGDADARTLAGTYGISEGKAQLCLRLTALDSTLTMDALANMSVSDILTLAAKHGLDLAGLLEFEDSDYTPLSTTDQITAEEAKQIVLKLVGGGTVTECELDYDRGIWEYEIEVVYDGCEYDYSINAVTGAVLSSEKTKAPAAPAATAAPEASGAVFLTQEQAIALVLSQVPGGTLVECEWDDDGHYDIAVRLNNTTYEYEADPRTSAIVLTDISGMDADDSAPVSSASSRRISSAEAKQIARQKAGGGTVTSCELEYENGRWIYEIELTLGSYEYDIEVHAETGEVLKSERELEDDIDEDDDD